MRKICLALIGAVMMAPVALGQPVSAPKIAAGDTWTYRNTQEKGVGWQQTRIEATVLRATPDEIEISSKVAGSNMPPRETLVGADWSRTRSVNGRDTVVNRPLLFPLTVGKTWVIDYSENHPNRQHSNEHFHTPYKVTGMEDVTVPAGTFHAYKIESEGQWTAIIAPAVGAVAGSRLDAQGVTTVMQTNRTAATPVSGRTYKAFWYVPEVKRWVKSVEEYYSSTGQRNERYTEELESYKVGAQP
jgi:hypothetical protein